jgi:ATP-binding cassette subfamily B multidrug efflux pump
VQEQLDSLNGVMQETLAGVRVVKMFVRGKYEQNRFGVINDSLTSRMLKATRAMAVTQPFMMLSMNLGVVGVLWFGGLQVDQGSMHVGQIIAFVNYLMLTLSSLMMVSMLVIQLARAVASAERIQEVLGSQPDVLDRVGALRELAPQGRVAFENVSFSYDRNESDLVLKGINLVAEPGQIVALLGVTGSGKSSLVYLIPRFYDVTSGRVTIDGVDVRDMEQEALHRHVSMVLQDTVLFSGTIRHNICYGRPDASEDEIIAAAKAAQAHEFILSMPDGYDTLLGQRAVNLSGGQKQRIAIARALLVNPAVLILDDSTSSVDVETSGKIHAAIKDLAGHITRFIIAQRVSTLLEADKVVVLDEGCIAAEGTHNELMETSSIYREIYESQLGEGGAQNE